MQATQATLRALCAAPIAGAEVVTELTVRLCLFSILPPFCF